MAKPRKDAPVVNDADPWMSVQDAAEALEETRYTILHMCVRGELESQQVAGRTVIARASVEEILRERESASGARR